MAIRGNISKPTINVLAADTVILEPVSGSVERIAVSGFSLVNTSVGGLTITIYESPNLTSASGKIIAYYSLASNESADVNECIGQGFTQNIIAVASGLGINAKISYTTYSAGD